METLDSQGPTRRVVLAGAGAAALAALGGCATYGPGNAPPPPAEEAPPAEEEPTPLGTASPGPKATKAAPPPLADTSEIPVGGGKIFDGRRVVVTQPQAGTFKAFSAVCTHQGCLVAEVSNGNIVCPCHGSAFKIADGSVARGPAAAPLSEKKITVKGSAITLG
jgi:Rieske Fe-S protein